MNKLGVVYISVPCFPKQFQSLLENIFFVQLFRSSARKDIGNNIFQVVIDELKYLESVGIAINVDGINYHL